MIRGHGLHLGGIPHEDRHADALVHHLGHGLEDQGMRAFGEHHALGVGLGAVDDAADHILAAALEAFEALLVGLHVGDGRLRHAGLHRSLGDGRSHPQQHPGIEGLGDDVLGAEGELLARVGLHDGIRHFLLGQGGQGLRGGQLHLLIDLGGADIQGAPEDEGEAQDIVHLVRIVAAARGQDDVVAGGLGGGVVDLGIGVGQGEDDGVLGHAQQHLGRQCPLAGAAHEDIGILDGVGQGAPGAGLGEALLVGVHALGAARVDQPLGVAEPQVLELDARADHHVRAGDGGGAGTAEHHLHVPELLLDDLGGVHQGRGADDGRAVLVVVEDGDIHLLLQPRLDLEALGGLDVLQVHASEGGLQRLHHLAEAVDVQLVHLDVEHVDVGKALEQHALALHHGLAGEGADVAQAQHGGAIGDHGHQVALGGVLVGIFRILLDFQAGLRHARRVGIGQVPRGGTGLRGDDFDLALPSLRMVIEGFLLAFHGHTP